MEFIEHLKSSVDIVGVIGEYVRLRRIGGGARYMGLCPFHAEKTPSFSVHSGHQFYKCFGCNAGGDVIKFVMEMERLTFWEAVKQLAERNGIPLPKRTDLTDEESRRRGRLLEIQALAAQHFARTLAGPSGSEACDYLARRGVSPETCKEFALGYAERSGQTLLRVLEKSGFTGDEMESSGLVLRRTEGAGFYDRFRDRLIFPIHSESGKVIAFGGRALEAADEPKYLNSPETPLYRKGAVLYNLNRARKAIQEAGCAILVEGYMDVIGVYAAGIHNVVATCGTALTPAQVSALRRHAPETVLNFDPDKAGRSATERSIDVLLNERMQVRVLELPEGVDPDEYILEHSAEAYADLVKNQARRYFHWLAERARGKFDVRTPEGRVAIFQFLLPQIQKMPDRIERLQVVDDVSEYLKIDAGLVRDEFRRAAAERREARPLPPPASPFLPHERRLLRALLETPAARPELARRLSQVPSIGTFVSARIFEAMLRMIEAGEPVSYAAVEARLGDEDKNRLAFLIHDDEESADLMTPEQALAALERLEADTRKAEMAELRQRIKAAERSGNVAEAVRLAAEIRVRRGAG
ncbi:MAG: DNA primase [Bryobacteraceae bacterium]